MFREEITYGSPTWDTVAKKMLDALRRNEAVMVGEYFGMKVFAHKGLPEGEILVRDRGQLVCKIVGIGK